MVTPKKEGTKIVHESSCYKKKEVAGVEKRRRLADLRKLDFLIN